MIDPNGSYDRDVNYPPEEIPDGYYQCWDCGDLNPTDKKCKTCEDREYGRFG